MGKYGGFQRAFVLLAALTVGVRCGDAERDPSPTTEGGQTGAMMGGAAGLGASSGAYSGGSPGNGGAPPGMGGAVSGGKAANDWQPDFPLGEPGWKDSREPFCDVNRGRVASGGVFADARGVFAIVNDECVLEGRDLPYCPPEKQLTAGASLSFNDGSGWRPLLDSDPYEIHGLSGFANGPLLLQLGSCSATLFDVEAATSRCSLESGSSGLDPRAFVVNDSLAYVIDQAGLHEYSGGSWSTLAVELPETINALWANDELVYLAGEYQLYTFTPGAQRPLQALPSVPAAQYTAVWGFASDDVWFGNSIGQLIHYDGQSFRRGPISTASDGDYPGITQLWGSEGELFFSSFSSFGRVTLATAEPETLVKVRALGFCGTSPRDLFIGVSDDGFTETACGAAFFLYFDGHEFHRF